MISTKTSCLILRITFALVYGWFGALKLFNLSPADELIMHTASFMHLLDPHIMTKFFGFAEVMIAICLLIPQIGKLSLYMVFAHMILTFMPFLVHPELCFAPNGKMALNIVGQYIVKNVVFIAAIILLISLQPKATKGANVEETLSEI